MTRLSRLLASLILLTAIFTLGIAPLEAARARPTTPIFVDTDIGVDDAVAIAYLLRERSANIVGFTTVFGNTSVDNATRNLLTLLDVADVEEPVTIGAAAPLLFPRSRTGAFVHGPDGFWFAQQPHDISGLPHDAPAAIAAAARANPNLTIIALGPLTNLALAVQQYPADMAGVRLVALGGGRRGNITPVAEFNIYSDPQALDVVLGSAMKVELVTLDAFDQVRVQPNALVEKLASQGGAVGQLLAPLVGAYAQATTQGAGGPIAIPDAVAAVYALHSDFGTPTSSLVRVITDSGYARGQTIIADTFSGRVSLIASDEELSALADQAFTPGFDLNAAIFAILTRQPDNAQVVFEVKKARIEHLLTRELTR